MDSESVTTPSRAVRRREAGRIHVGGFRAGQLCSVSPRLQRCGSAWRSPRVDAARSGLASPLTRSRRSSSWTQAFRTASRLRTSVHRGSRTVLSGRVAFPGGTSAVVSVGRSVVARSSTPAHRRSFIVWRVTTAMHAIICGDRRAEERATESIRDAVLDPTGVQRR